MSKQTELIITDSCLTVKGTLDFASVVPLQAEGDRWLREQAANHCCVDLSGVTFSNSAGTALLLAWMRTALASGKILHVENTPPNLIAMLRLGGLADVLLN